MKINTKDLITQLIEKTNSNISRAQAFKSLSDSELNYKSSAESWSILECIEHLNRYGDFYNPEIKSAIQSSSTTSAQVFKSGVIGNYFVNLMIPKTKLKTMKTATINNPIGSQLDKNTIDKFIQQQIECLTLIEQSKSINLTKVKTKISISKLIKIKLGDTLRFVTAHNDRHLLQAENILNSVKNK